MKSIFRKIIPLLSWPVAVAERFIRGRGVRILMYHRVSELRGDRLSVRPTEFQKQMEFLRVMGFRVVAIDEITHPPSQNQDSGSPVVLTFDDGYRDFYEIVFPVLKAFHFPATIFIVTGLVEGYLRLQRYRGHADNEEPLSWEMLKEMTSAGITVGAHSVTHRELTTLSLKEAQKEIGESARIIARRLGKKPLWFAYPRGSFTAGIKELVKNSGYQGAVSVRPGCARFPRDRFALGRTEISGDDDLWDFQMKLNGAFDLWHRIWQSQRIFPRKDGITSLPFRFNGKEKAEKSYGSSYHR